MSDAQAMRIVEITDADGRIVEPEWLARAELVHRQLRANLDTGYPANLARVFAGGGRMAVAIGAPDAVVGVALWRCYENTYNQMQMYIDDLVTDAAARSAGVGHALIVWLEARARESGCRKLTLDSGTQRRDAHRFYLRERFQITAFHFEKAL